MQVISLPPIKNTVHDSIDLIERTFLQHSEDDALKSFGEVQDWPFKYESTKAVFHNQAHMVRLTAIERGLVKPSDKKWSAEPTAMMNGSGNWLK